MTTIPKTLESPPRTTGNAQQDFPLVLDWMFRAYQVIQQSVEYINSQVSGADTSLTLTDLPDPNTATVASAQNTANQAYTAAIVAQEGVSIIGESIMQGEVTISDASTGDTVSFDEDMEDADYVVIFQVKSSSGTPATNSYIIATKTYGISDFSFTLLSAPGAGKSITFDWILIRNI